MEYKVSEIAKMFGIPASTIRYYDKHNILPFMKRNAAGDRETDFADISSFGLILTLKDGGFSLKEIQGFIEEAEALKFADDESEALSRMLQQIDSHIETLFERQEKLLNQMKVTKFLRWYFDSYDKSGEYPNEEAYPGSFPKDLHISCENGKEFLREELWEAYVNKYNPQKTDLEEDENTHE